MLYFVSFLGGGFLFFTTICLVDSRGGCWSLSHLHTGTGRVLPWMCRQLIVGPLSQHLEVHNWDLNQGPSTSQACDVV